MSAVEHYEPPANGFRTFVAVWATQSLSMLGNAVTFFATIIWLSQVLYPASDQKAQLGLAISLVSLSAAIPIVFGAPIAGAWADRHDRKRTMIVVDVGSGFVTLLTASLMFAGVLELWMLIIITAVNAVLGAFHMAAFDTSYAMLLRNDQLPRANGMMQTSYPMSSILAPTVAATIIALPGLAQQGIIGGPVGDWLRGFSDGVPLALVLDAITFFAMGVVLLFLHIPSPKRADLYHTSGKRKSIWEDVREGIGYILQRRPLLWLLATFAVANFVSGGMAVIIPLVVKFNLSADWSAQGLSFEAALAVIGVVAGIGELLGGIFMSAWGGLKKMRVYGVLVPMIVEGLTLVVFGLSPLLFLTAGAQFVHLAMYPVMGAHSQSIWQSQTPRALQGRVFSVRRLIAQFTRPFSTLFAGVAGGLFNPGVVIASLGLLLVVFCVTQLFNPNFVHMEANMAASEAA